MNETVESPYAPPSARIAEVEQYSGTGPVVYAGFWKRAAALTIDSFLTGIVYYGIVLVGLLVAGIGFGSLSSGTTPPGPWVLLYLCYPVISGLYFVLLESSASQATLGKRAVGIKVTDTQGRRLSRGHALGRWASHLLSYVTLYIGYLMAAFTTRKQGLHDMAASTLVVDRWAFTNTPERQRKELGAVTIVVLILALLLVLAYIGVLFAVMLPMYQAQVMDLPRT